MTAECRSGKAPPPLHSEGDRQKGRAAVTPRRTQFCCFQASSVFRSAVSMGQLRIAAPEPVHHIPDGGA